MPLATHAATLLDALKPDDFHALSPAERRRFADLAHHAAELAELRPKPPAPKLSGVLIDLRGGRPG